MTYALDGAIADGGLLTTAFVRIAGFAEGEIVGREAASISGAGRKTSPVESETESRAFTMDAFRRRAQELGDNLNEAGIDAFAEGWTEGWQSGFRAATAAWLQHEINEIKRRGAAE